ncbi:MAG: hypothetical protein JRC86_11880 [Deltaproteobacteria bacterium]|nr:hypothetical protein [Deltaproteobacteria bacterium]
MKKQELAKEVALGAHIKRDWRFAHGIWTGVKSAVWGQPIFRCYLTADQENITDSTDTKIEYNGITYDRIGAGLSSYGFPAPRTGAYFVTLNIMMKSLAANCQVKSLIKVGSTTKANVQGHTAIANNYSPPPATDIIEVDQGDVIYGYVYHNSGTNNPDLLSNQTRTFMTIAWIGEQVS